MTVSYFWVPKSALNLASSSSKHLSHVVSMGQKLRTGLIGLGSLLRLWSGCLPRLRLSYPHVGRVLEGLPRWFPFTDGELALAVGRAPQFCDIPVFSCDFLCALTHNRWLHQKWVIQELHTLNPKGLSWPSVWSHAPIFAQLMGAQLSPVQLGAAGVWMPGGKNLGVHAKVGCVHAWCSFFWHRAVTVVGISHLLVSDVLGSAESSPLF